LVHRQTKNPCLSLKIIAAIIAHSRQENQARIRQFLPRNSYRFSGNEMLLQKQVLPKGNFFDQKIRKEIFGTGSKVKTVFQKLPKVLVIIK